MKAYGFFIAAALIFAVFTLNAQVAINNTGATAEESAILDISSNNKGMLIPRMSLTELDNTSSPVSDPVPGLLIYNTQDSPEIPVGFYYWGGSEWTQVMGDNTQTINNISSHMYESGELYEDNVFSSPSTTSLPNPSTYVGWKTATEGEKFGNTTTNVSDATADKIIVGEDGLYNIQFCISYSGSNNFEIETSIFHTPLLTGTAGVTRIKVYRKFAALDVGSASASGLLRLKEGDAIDLRFRSISSSGEQVAVYNLNLVVNKVGDL